MMAVVSPLKVVAQWTQQTYETKIDIMWSQYK